jgi:hypothetical protein
MNSFTFATPVLTTTTMLILVLICLFDWCVSVGGCCVVVVVSEHSDSRKKVWYVVRCLCMTCSARHAHHGSWTTYCGGLACHSSTLACPSSTLACPSSTLACCRGCCGRCGSGCCCCCCCCLDWQEGSVVEQAHACVVCVRLLRALARTCFSVCVGSYRRSTETARTMP